MTKNSNESEYQDLIEEFLARGGKITRCEDGEAEGALELDKQQPSMDQTVPHDAQQWDDYFDMNHVGGSQDDTAAKVNRIKRTPSARVTKARESK